MPRSLVLRRYLHVASFSCCPVPLVGLPVAPDEPVTREVEGQGHQEQCRTNREYGLVGYRTSWRLPAYDLHYVSRHRLHAFEGTSPPVRLGSHRDGHDHGLPDGPRDTEDHRRRDPGERRGHNDIHSRLTFGRAERVGAFPQGKRHRVDGVLAHRGDRRDDHHAHDKPGGDRVERLYTGKQAVPEERGDEREREVPVYHRRYAGQDLERRLEPLPQAPRGVLAEVDGREQAYRERHGHRDEGRHQRAVDQRQNPKLAPRRRPLSRGQKLHRRDLQEEPRGLLEEHDDDPDRREYGQVRAGREQELDDTLSELPGAAVALPDVSP